MRQTLCHSVNLFKSQLIRLPFLALVLSTCGSSEDLILEGRLDSIADLPAALAENSGMIFWENMFWFINDGGNAPVLYAYDPGTSAIAREVTILDTENTDWEEVSQDDSSLYIGDFGNNAGSRDDLRIVRVSKKDIMSSDQVHPSAVIRFSYSDQTEPEYNPENTSFDCEAFVVSGDSILLFSKDWVTLHTSVYVLDATGGEDTARLAGIFNCNGLVTASCYNKDDKELVLLGYSNYSPFIYLIPGFQTQEMNFNRAVRIEFSAFLGVQAEGVAVAGKDKLYISSEETIYPPRLYRVEY